MKIEVTPFIFIDHMMANGGVLPDSKAMESSAAWYFAKCAHQAIDSVTEQVGYEGETDETINLRPLADSVCSLYGVNIEEMMKLMPLVRREAFRCNIFWNDRFQAWLDSGGRAYNEVTREPGAFGNQ